MLLLVCFLTAFTNGFLVPPIIKDFPIPKLEVHGVKYYAVNRNVTVSCVPPATGGTNVSLQSLSPENKWISLPVKREGTVLKAKIQVTGLFRQRCCVEDKEGKSRCTESVISTGPSFFVDRPTEPGIPLDKTNVTEGETLRFTCWAPPDPQIKLVLSHRFSPKAIREAVKYSNESGHYLIANSYVRGIALNKFTCEIHVKNQYKMQKTEEIKANWLSKSPLPLEAGFMNVSDFDYNEDVKTLSSTPYVKQTPLPFPTATIVSAGIVSILTVGVIMLIYKCRRTVKDKRKFVKLTHYAHVNLEDIGGTNDANLLGSGQFGAVHRGEWTVNGITYQVAYKVFNTELFTNKDDGLKELRSELNKQQCIPYHPHIVTLLAAITTKKGAMAIVMELCEPISLRDYVINKGEYFSKMENRIPKDDMEIKRYKKDLIKELVCYATQICRGMEHLHKGVNGQYCLHMDLAARNVLRKNGLVMISDFGMAHMGFDGDGYYPLNNRMRPMEYYAPECLGSWNFTEEKIKRDYNGKSRFSKRSDVWSFGMLLHEVFSYGVRPLSSYKRIIENIEDKPCQKILEFLEKGGRLEKPLLCPDNVFDIVQNQCWQFSSKDRPDFSDLNTKFTELLKAHYYNTEEMETFNRNVERRKTDQEEWRQIVHEAEHNRSCFSSWRTWISCCESTTVQEENIGYSLEEEHQSENSEPTEEITEERTEVQPLCTLQEAEDENAS